MIVNNYCTLKIAYDEFNYYASTIYNYFRHASCDLFSFQIMNTLSGPIYKKQYTF